jgi:hypothetical protein
MLLTGLILTGLALADFAYLEDNPVAWMVRWIGRLALYASIPVAAWMVRLSARRGSLADPS